jgi:hypothetical protein
MPGTTLARSGRSHDFRVQDLRLAAQAIERKLTLLTENPKECRKYSGRKFVAVIENPPAP